MKKTKVEKDFEEEFKVEKFQKKKLKDLDIKTSDDIDYSDDLKKYLKKLKIKEVKKLGYILRDAILTFAPKSCDGQSCIYADKCPFLQAGLAPVGKACILEILVLEKRKREYLKKLKVDTKDGFEMKYVEDLLLLDLFEMRVNADLAQNGLINVNVHIVSNKGDAYTRREVSPAWEIRKSIMKLRNELLKEYKQYKRQKKEMGEEDDILDVEVVEEVNKIVEDFTSQISIVKEDKNSEEEEK